MTEFTCDTALEQMLEAAPAELRGEADTDLARHIAGCRRCAAVAAAMVEELEAVDDALAEHATSGPTLAAESALAADAGAAGREADPYAAADAAADAALAAIRQDETRDIVSLDRRRRTAPDGARPDRAPAAAHAPTGPAPPGSSRRWPRAAWVPLAAAAALAAVLVFNQDDPFSGPTDITSPPEPTLEPRVAVTPPADKGAAIMETENPNITIVWLYEREGT
jgi:hypothetical protein